MARWRFAAILPCAMLAVSVGLAKWPYRTPRVDTLYLSTAWMFDLGLNAPAQLLNVFTPLLYRVDRTPWNIFGFDQSQVLFFIGVILLWYLVGRGLDDYVVRRGAVRPITIRESIPYVFLLLLSIPFFIEGAVGLRTPGQWNNFLGNDIESIFFLAWAVAMVLIPGAKFAGAIRRARAAGSDGGSPRL